MALSSSTTTHSSRDAANQSKLSVQKYLTNCRSFYSCIYCRTHLANHDELVSRSFQGNHGRAYLFNSVINISCGPAVQRELNTGSHAVADIFCETCAKTLGWKYEKAYVEAQKYKEGKFIIELAHVVRENRHLEFDKGEMFFGNRNSNNGRYNQRHSSSRSNLKAPSLVGSEGYSSGTSVSSSPVLAFDDNDDPELMSPLYDDLLGSYSNYPNSLSMSHHNRMRRSLYLDSTPYDWKHSATSSSENQYETTIKLASSLGSSNSSPSSSSSPPTSSPSSPASANSSPSEQRQNPYQIAGDDEQRRTSRRSCNQEEGGCPVKEEEDDETSDFQFEFEADRPSEADSGEPVQTHDNDGGNCDQIVSERENADDRSIYERSLDGSSKRATSQSDLTHNMDTGGLNLPSGSGLNYSKFDHGSDRLMQAVSSDSCSLDDEKFYDCNSDHVVSNLMMAPDSPSQAESYVHSN